MSWAARNTSSSRRSAARPARDLVARIPNLAPASPPASAADPGTSTEVLRQRYPDAESSASKIV